eukprot:1203854-Rhodomonas_salina.1
MPLQQNCYVSVPDNPEMLAIYRGAWEDAGNPPAGPLPIQFGPVKAYICLRPRNAMPGTDVACDIPGARVVAESSGAAMHSSTRATSTPGICAGWRFDYHGW